MEFKHKLWQWDHLPVHFIHFTLPSPFYCSQTFPFVVPRSEQSMRTGRILIGLCCLEATTFDPLSEFKNGQVIFLGIFHWKYHWESHKRNQTTQTVARQPQQWELPCSSGIWDTEGQRCQGQGLMKIVWDLPRLPACRTCCFFALCAFKSFIFTGIC